MPGILNVSRETFPKSEVTSKGMISLNIECDNREMNYIPDIEYIQREDIRLYIELMLPDDITDKTPLIMYVKGSAFFW